MPLAPGESRVASEQTALPISGSGSLTAFRYSSYDVPFWARNNTRDGRWHRVGAGPTQYWSLCPEAAWAELIRYEDLKTEGELDDVRMPLWVCRVPMLGLLDLRDADAHKGWGLDTDALVADDWRRTQEAGASIRRHVKGIITASAALPGHGNVTLFGARRAVDWHSRPRLASTLPTTRAAIGRPPPGLIPHVRRRGQLAPDNRLF